MLPLRLCVNAGVCHEPEARKLRIFGSFEGDPLSAQENCTLFRVVDAGQYLHQCRFACAVLPNTHGLRFYAGRRIRFAA